MSTNLKRVAYVSTISLSRADSAFSIEMMKILNHARVANRTHGLTGILMLDGATVVQFIEGDATSVATLLYKISKDSRHTDVSVFVNRKVDERIFSDWSMRLITEGTALREQMVAKVREHHERDLTMALTTSAARLRPFFGGSKANGSHGFTGVQSLSQGVQTPAQALSSDSEFEKVTMTLNSWPRPSQLKMTKNLIKLCSSLSSGSRSLADLRVAAEYEDEASLISSLHHLEGLGLLKRQALTVNRPAVVASSSGGRFSRVLKRFIENNRHH